MMNETIATIQKRRSIRAYDEKQIEDDLLNLIIESGQYAPSGGNR
jgi:nitroreductase